MGFEADHAGVLLLAAGQVELDLPGAVAYAKLPGTPPQSNHMTTLGENIGDSHGLCR